MKFLVFLTVLLGGAVSACADTEFASIISNGDFAPGPCPSAPEACVAPWFATYGQGAAIPGWTVTWGTVDWIGKYWQAPPGGGFSIDLDGWWPGGISQTVDTVPGQHYVLSFYLAGNPDGAPDRKQVLVSVGALSFPYSPPKSPSRTDMEWSLETLGFTATELSTTISFTSEDTNSPYGPALGGVSLIDPPVPVPEPGFYAECGSMGLLLAGFWWWSRPALQAKKQSQ